MSENDLEQINEQMPPPAYFGSLTIENLKCFKGKHEIDLSDGDDKPAMWTVILGENNTGKTTLLRCFADLEPAFGGKDNDEKIFIPKILTKTDKLIEYSYPFICLIECKWMIDNATSDIWEFKRFKWSNNIAYKSSSSVQYEYYRYNIENTKIYSYGTSRRMGNSSLSDNGNQDNSETLFNENTTLINAEEWLMQTDYASKKIELAKFRLEKIESILTNGLLPDVKKFKYSTKETNGRIENFVEVETDYGWVKLRDLGYGYQVTLAWVVDLAKKLFERYPNSDNPLHEPAIVLVDEIDLHLHPDWQRKIIKFLRAQFPKTQFIVTTHSPLIVQSADNINLVLLKKQDDHVVIEQPDLKTYKGWTVEEILDELMGLGDKTASDDYLQFMREFDEGLDEDNYAKAKQAYNELDKILHPQSSQRKLLRIQMSSLMPE